MKHVTRLEPQPIADQWMAKCSCGWTAKVSAYEFDDMHAEAKRLADHHQDSMKRLETNRNL